MGGRKRNICIDIFRSIMYDLRKVLVVSLRANHGALLICGEAKPFLFFREE